MNCHRNSKVTNHFGYTLMSMSSGVTRSPLQNIFCCLCYFCGRSSSNFKPLGLYLLFSCSCHTQWISIMTAFSLYGFCHCQTINGLSQGVLKGLRGTKKAAEANWPNKLVLHIVFLGPQSPLLMKGPKILPWRGQWFAKPHFKLVKCQAKTLLPTLASKSQWRQHSRGWPSTAWK